MAVIRRITQPTEEELAKAEQRLELERQEREFEENRELLNRDRPKGAARISRSRAFRASTPPLTRSPIEYAPPDDTGEETPAEVLRRVNTGATPVAPPDKRKKKGKFEVPENRTVATVIKAIGDLYVKDRQSDPIQAFQNLRDAIMSNLDILLPAMPQIKQMFELLQLGEPERPRRGENGEKAETIGRSMKKIRGWLTGEDDDD